MVWRRCHPQGESSTEITHTQPLPKNTLHPQNNTHFDGKASSLFPICEVGQHKKHPGFNPGDNNSPNNFYTYFSSDIINYYHSFNNQWQPGDQKLPNQMLPLPDKTSRTVTPGSSLQQLILQSWEVSSMTKSLCFINKYMLSFFKKILVCTLILQHTIPILEKKIFWIPLLSPAQEETEWRRYLSYRW